MNKIVKEHYPVAQLPEELRKGLNPGATVTITVEEEETRPKKVMTLDEIFAARQPPFRTMEEIDRSIEEMRDEWEERSKS